MRGLLLTAVAALSACVEPVDPCAGLDGTCLAVHVDGAGEVDRIDELIVHARGSGLDAQRSTRSSGHAAVLLPAAVPLQFPDVPAGVTLVLDLQVSGELDGQVVGGGVVSATVEAGAHASAHLSISPRTIPDGGPFTVAITQPADTAYTNGMLTVDIDAQPGEVDQLELLVDGVTRQSWPGVAPVRYAWDTTVESEGAHTLVARVTSGPSSVDSEPRTVYVDRTPPQITSRAPGGTGDVDTLQPFRVTFSEPIAPDSLSGVTLTAGGQAVAVTTSLVAPDTLSIEPIALPPLPAQASISLASITDRAGNPIGPDSWSFAVPAWVQVGTDLGATTTRFVLAAGPWGQLFAGQGTFDSQSVTWLHVKKWDGTAWSELGTGFAPVPATGVVDVQALAVDNLGQPVLLYRARPDANSAYAHQVMRWNDGAQAWQPLGPPITTGDVSSALATGEAGEIVAAYPAPDGTGNSLFAVRWDGAAWQSLGPPVSHGSGGPDAPAIAVDQQGDAVLAFRERVLGSVSAFAGVFHQGQYQQLSGPVPNGGLDAFPGSAPGVGLPVLALDHGDHPLIAFIEPDAASAHDLFVYRWDTAAWPALATAAPSNVGSACSLTVDGMDRPVALYHDNKVKPSGWVIRWDPGVSRWVPLGDAPVAPGLQHVLVTDSNGRVVVGSGANGRVFRSNQ